MKSLIFLILIIGIIGASQGTLNKINDDRLVELIREGKNLVVLFSEYSLNLLKHVFFFFDTYTYLS
jgi:hypothetical protein